MKIDRIYKNLFFSIVSFLLTYFLFKFVGVTIDAGFWLMYIFLLLIYMELLDMPKKK